MPQIDPTVLATSYPDIDICKGFALFPGVTNARAGISKNASISKLVDIKPTAILTWRLSLGLSVGVTAGVCGPAYGTIMSFKDIDYDNQRLAMTLESDKTDAGLIWGFSVNFNFFFELDTLSVRWIDDGWNSRLESTWQISSQTSFDVTFDLFGFILELITGKLGKAGDRIQKVQDVFQAGGGSYAIFGSEEDVIAEGEGRYTVSPSLDLPINIIGLLKKIPVVGAATAALEKIGISLSVGPIISLLIPVDFAIAGFGVDGAEYTGPITWTDDGLVATYRQGAVPPAASQLSVSIQHVAARRFGLKIGIFFDFNFLKVFSVNQQFTYDMPDLLKIGPKFDTITNKLSNKAGSKSVGFDPLHQELDENEYEVVFA